MRLTLESELPAELAVGRGSALFVCGWCFCAEAAIESLAFVVDGVAQPVAAHSMPRLDPFRALHPGVDPYATADVDRDPESAEDPELRSYRSGFWGLVRVGPRPAGSWRSRCGRVWWAAAWPRRRSARSRSSNRSARCRRRRSLVGEPPDEPLVVICMATYNPAPELLRAQLRSIRAQTTATGAA